MGASIAVAQLKSFTQAARVSQPTWTAQIKKLEDARLLRPFCGHRRMVRNLLPMPERALQDLNTVQLDVQEAAAGVAWMRIAALPRRSFKRGPALFSGKGVRLRSLSAIRTRLNAGTWIRIEVRDGATSPG